MSITVIEQGAACRLIFDGSLTYECARELEEQIQSFLDRFERLEIDLSAVYKIDLFGLHLLGLIQGREDLDVNIVANSEAVQQAPARLLSSPRRSWLNGRHNLGMAAS